MQWTKVRLCYGFVISCSLLLSIKAQEPVHQQDEIAAYVLMDSVVVKPGIDISYFIQLMQDDQSLYRSFKTLRTIPYIGHYTMQFSDQKGVAQASWMAKGIQNCEDQCCTHHLEKSWQLGNLLRKDGRFNYYTALLFHKLFLMEETYCHEEEEASLLDRIEDEEQAHVRYLKQLIFQPGVGLDIPLVGHQTDIFSKEHFTSYRFYFTEKVLKEQAYYVFTADLKEGEELPIQYLETWFTQDDLQITQRHFHVQTNQWVYEADVVMSIMLQKYQQSYIPLTIHYAGVWDIPGSKAENGNFQISIEPNE
jgi:hypothetical protein